MTRAISCACAATPEQLHAISCENFLEVAQGSLATVPISKSTLAYWGVPAKVPQIGCASMSGKPLARPQPAELVSPPRETSTLVGVWTATRPHPVRGLPHLSPMGLSLQARSERTMRRRRG